VNSAAMASPADLFSALAASFHDREAFLHAVFDPLPYGVVLFDASLRVAFMSDALVRAMLDEEQPRGDSLAHLYSIIHFIDPETMQPAARESMPPSRAVAGEIVMRREYLMRRIKTGGSLWVECSAWPLRDSSGSIHGAVMTVRDITLMRKQEMALDAAGKMHQFIYHGNVAGIIRSTVDGCILDCNDAAVRMFRFASREQMLGMRAQHLYFDAAERDRVLRLLQQPRQLSEVEVCYRRGDGSRLWAMINVRMLDPQTGEVGGSLVAILMDITERKRHEDIVRQSEERFSAFMRHLPGVAFIKDLNGRYVYYNDACEQLFGKHPSEIVGKTDAEIWPPEIAASYRENDLKVLESVSHSEFIEPVEQTGGRHTWLIYKFPITENGKAALVAGIGIDITERQTLSEQLNDARKMEALGRLAGGVAHDFNNLLTVISGYGQMAIEGVGHTPSERMITYLQQILNSARKASGLTGQLLAFSRKQVVQERILDLGELLRNMQMLLQRVIGENIDLNVRARSGCMIRSDANQIEQVLMNLAVNARDAMPLGGSLEIACSRLEMPLARESGPPLGILLEVRDNGIGMEESIKAQIFEPFFTRKEKGKGTGLGLSTVYGIISQAGGHIEVESRPGEGATFRLWFPEAEGEADILAPAKIVQVESGSETVLLVEDEPDVRALTSLILSRMGYRVLTAEHGPAALELWKQRAAEVDVLLTDVIMPQMSGVELAQKLRAQNPELRVLFMSGYTDDMIAKHGLRPDEISILEKPFTSELLASKLRTVLDK
jgi:two-component system, cell cycle sensor histidine kinase and response regulator CckA